MFIEWSKDLSVGVDEIDEDHLKLIAIVNRFHEAYVSGADKSAMLATLTEIADYSGWHFDHEENVMRRFGFPHLERHAGQHSDLLNRMDQILVDFEVGKSELSEDLFEFLRNWIVIHLKTEDRELGEWVRSKSSST